MKKKFEDMTEEEQREHRFSDFGVTFFNGSRWEQNEEGHWTKDGKVVQLGTGEFLRDGKWLKPDETEIGSEDEMTIHDSQLVRKDANIVESKLDAVIDSIDHFEKGK